ncbi:MAG: hypothetical protein ACK5MM_17280 [Planctomyces sp.]
MNAGGRVVELRCVEVLGGRGSCRALCGWGCGAVEVVVSLLPVVIEWVSAVREGRREREQSGGEGAGSGGGV